MGIYQNNEPVEIVVDDRERESNVIDCLRSIPAVSVRIDRLLLGDYQANRRLLFERKTLQDFTRSIVDGRLFNQLNMALNPIRRFDQALLYVNVKRQ